MSRTPLERAQALCARAEHSVAEIRRKLAGWGATSSETEKIIAELKEQRYLNDERFARAYVRDKLRFSGWGRRKILVMLYSKGIDRPTSTAALEDIDTHEYEQILRRVLRVKQRQLGPEESMSYEGRVKMFRYAVGRGFESELIARILKNIKGNG
ncbi:MAG: recombination regulator RecX [Muribaculaceae bacterium]|nr:recombination regulator RecX [Muribaculaceae bacterium]